MYKNIKKQKAKKRKESTREKERSKENDLSMIEYLNAASELLLKYRLFWKSLEITENISFFETCKNSLRL